MIFRSSYAGVFLRWIMRRNISGLLKREILFTTFLTDRMAYPRHAWGAFYAWA